MAATGAAGTAWFTGIKDTKADTKHVPHDSGLSVGVVSEQGDVTELQEEVRQLAERIFTDSQRFADYENEIRVLKAQLRQEKRRNQSDDANRPQTPIAPIAPPQPPGLSRFGSFIGSRKPVPQSPPNRERELEAALAQERSQRLAAEQKVTQVNGEIEELSTTLFQQANDMVSTERRENAALKERIRLLEEREVKFSSRLEALEKRETDRKRRMERLESAVKRIERARALLVPR